MKKIISLALAASMVAGMAVTSFAASATDPTTEAHIKEGDSLYVWTKKLTDVKGIKEAFLPYVKDSEQEYGMTYGLKVDQKDHNDDAMKKLNAYADWTVGGKYIDGKPSLELKKFQVTAAIPLDKFNLIAGTEAKMTLKHKLTKDTTVTIINANTEVNVEITLPTTANMSASALQTAIETAANTACTSATIAAGTTAGTLDPADVKLIKAAAVAALTPKYVEEITAATYAYGWFATFSTVDDTNFKGARDIRGVITVAKSQATAKENFKDATVSKKIDFNGILTDVSNFYTLDGDIMDLEFTGSVFTVDTVGISRVLSWNGTAFNKDIVAKYPNAELSFFDWKDAKNPTFNRTGTLAFYTENKETKVYEILADGTLKLLDSKYDEDQEAVTIRTRTLGNYVLSNVELVLDAPVVDAPVVDAPVDDVKPNPETGR